MNFSDMLAQLIAELPEAMRGGTAVETVLRKSGDLADLEAVAQLVRGRSGNCPGDIRCTRAQPSEAYDLPLAKRDCTASRQMGRPIFVGGIVDARGPDIAQRTVAVLADDARI
jgi:hypothetical protein